MKELSIEQKAKAYDELKVKAQELTEDGYIDKLALLDLFPELKESEDERIRKELIKETKGSEVRLFETVTNEELVAWLEKQGEHTPAWSEEDEVMLKEALRMIERPGSIFKGEILTKKVADWLKSIKGRVQPKQEWSEEDNIILSRIIADYERSNEEWFNAQNSLPHGRKITWLKSLRPQNRWKPSDEQMAALSDINCTGYISYAGQGQELINLYNGLKKLKS